MSYKLLIVESPTKVNSLGRYLDKPSEYKIASSKGHIRDLPRKGGINVDIENDFRPNYQISPDKNKLVKELRQLSQAATEVIMASDEDREGEAIAWHLCHILNLDPQKTKRITFNEITAEALKKALDNPRTINQDLVNAQQARRILDRIVGFELSPILWTKIKTGLSAGRVQSTAMRLIYEKEEEVKKFQPTIKTVAQATFEISQQALVAGLKNEIADLKIGREFMEDWRRTNPTDFKIADIVQKPSSQNPSPPLKTSTLQQAASTKLGFGVQRTMSLAQKLYEAGFITYMRTDSLNLSQAAQTAIKKEIVKTFGEKYYHHREYAQKSKGAQEAHEAIRPTNFALNTINELDNDAQKLYKLIYARTLASQMATAQTEKTTLFITDPRNIYSFTVQGQILRFAGFLEVLGESDKDIILPSCQKGDNVKLLEANIFEKLSNPPPRFNEASLVKKMEELGIGRPSTYAPTINTLLQRGYIVKGDVAAQIKYCQGLILQNGSIRDYRSEEHWAGSTNKLLPTALADLVTPFLKEHFSEIMNYDFTSQIESDFDQIALGQLNWTDHLKTFYKRFHPLITAAKDISRQEINQMQEVGKDPSDQKMIYARLGRLGPMLQKGRADDEEKPIFAPLPPNSTLKTVTLEEALKMFKFPKIVGQNKAGEDIIVKNGPYGPYLEIAKTRIALKDEDPNSVDLQRALELISLKEEADKKKIIKDFDGKLKILNGIYGPYVTDGQKNGKIPKEFKEQDLSQIDQTLAQQWLDETGKKPRRKIKKKTKSA